MTEHLNQKLINEWNGRWQGSEKEERLSILAKRMFVSKMKAMQQVVDQLDKPDSVIEVGCGLGHILEFYCKQGFNACGIDASTEAIKVCKKKGLPAKYLWLEDVSETYDLVSSDGMLEHFLNFEPYAKMMMDISNRYVLLIQPNHESFVGKTLVYLAELIKGDENVFEFNYRMKDFEEIFYKHGFALKISHPVFKDTFRILVFEKNQRM